MSNKPMILVVEDDAAVRNLMAVTLETRGYRYHLAPNGTEALIEATTHQPDVMLLDLGLPDMDGVEIIRKVRSWSAMPIIVISARSEDADKVEALDAGADDYLPKPFHAKELLARVRAILRRRSAYHPDLLRFSNFELDRSCMELRCGEQSARLTNKAFQLMEMLMENPRAVLSVQQIMEHVWGWESESEINVVWVNVSSLRKKLAEIGAQAEIRAVRGMGYALEAKE